MIRPEPRDRRRFRAQTRLVGIGLFAIVVCGLVGTPVTARAWTEAQVQGAETDVRLEGNGRIHVQMLLKVHVHGGWLEGLDIAGLDTGLELDETVPIRLVAEDGQTHVPTVRTRPRAGVISLGFRRRGAPRRGEYRVQVAYRATLTPAAIRAEESGERVQFEWTLPGWRSGLDGVVVRVDAPRGARWGDDVVGDHALMQHESAATEDGRTLLTWRRAHLPRTVSWPLRVSLPNAAVTEALRGTPVDGPAPLLATAPAERPRDRAAWALFAFFAFIALSKLWTFSRRARALGVVPRGVVPLPRLVRAAIIVALCAAGAYLWHLRTDLGLATQVLALVVVAERAAVGARPSKLGGYRAMTRAERLWAEARERVEAASPVTWFDVTRPAGLVTLLLGVFAVAATAAAWPTTSTVPTDEAAGAGVATVLHGLVLMAVMMLFATDAQLPSSVAARLARLTRLAGRFPACPGGVPVALGLSLHRDAKGRSQDARLRIATEVRAEGLVRLDVLIADRLFFGRYLLEPLVLVVTRAASPAEQALSAALPGHPTLSAPAGRRARTMPLHLLGTVVAAVGQAPSLRARHGVPTTPRAVASLTTAGASTRA